MQNNLIGTIDKIKPLTGYPVTLIRFTLIVGRDRINCVSRNKEIIDSVMCLVNGKNSVALFGNYNSRKQLNVSKLIVKDYYHAAELRCHA